MSSKHLLLSNSPFIKMSRKTCFTYTKEDFSIPCIVNMSVELVAKIKTLTSSFLCANFLLFCRHKEKKCSGGTVPNPHWSFPQDPLVGLQDPPYTQLYTRRLRSLLSVHLNNRSNKKTLFRPLHFRYTDSSSVTYF